jgi:hypothetical protein
MRPAIAVLVLPAIAPPARAQHPGCVNPERVDRRLAGPVDEAENHARDRRIVSTIPGMPRDRYVYRPLGDDPRRADPLVVSSRDVVCRRA